MGVFSRQRISPIFSLTAMCQTRIYLFVYLFLQKIKLLVLVSFKLELGTCLIIPDVSMKYSPAFQNIEAAFKKCSTKVVVHQNGVRKYSSTAPMVKSMKALRANLLKIQLHYRYFFKEFHHKFKTAIFKNASRWHFLRAIIFENIPEWLLLKGSCEDIFTL